VCSPRNHRGSLVSIVVIRAVTVALRRRSAGDVELTPLLAQQVSYLPCTARIESRLLQLQPLGARELAPWYVGETALLGSACPGRLRATLGILEVIALEHVELEPLVWMLVRLAIETFTTELEISRLADESHAGDRDASTEPDLATPVGEFPRARAARAFMTFTQSGRELAAGAFGAWHSLLGPCAVARDGIARRVLRGREYLGTAILAVRRWC
jgi:hypothetical protein